MTLHEPGALLPARTSSTLPRIFDAVDQTHSLSMLQRLRGRSPRARCLFARARVSPAHLASAVEAGALRTSASGRLRTAVQAVAPNVAAIRVDDVRPPWLTQPQALRATPTRNSPPLALQAQR